MENQSLIRAAARGGIRVNMRLSLLGQDVSHGTVLKISAISDMVAAASDAIYGLEFPLRSFFPASVVNAS